jgi:hypothetical protein
MPEMEFGNSEKGDALYAYELALSLEKLNFQKLQALHGVAESHGDAQMCDFVGERGGGGMAGTGVGGSCLCEEGLVVVVVVGVPKVQGDPRYDFACEMFCSRVCGCYRKGGGVGWGGVGWGGVGWGI